MSRQPVVERRHKSKKWEDSEVLNDNPMSDGRVRKFIEQTEGYENKGGDPRKDTLIKTSISEKQYQRQQEAMRRLKERGWRSEEDD